MARFASFTLLALQWLLLLGPVQGDAVKDLQDKGRPAIDAAIAKSKTCTKEKLQVRREWGDISAADKKAYIDAFLCVIGKPSKLDRTRFPGAQTRYDDFVVVHMNQTMNIHGTANFLSWHRYYEWSWERVLREECNFKGVQPYWDWGRWAADPLKSPIFDGSDLSMGGNGEKVQHTSLVAGFAAGNGGGCVKTGPFKNLTVRLGPLSAAISGVTRNPRADGYGDNARCLRRDISNGPSSRYTRTQDIVSLITGYNRIGPFQDKMQDPMSGVHSAGHYTIHGDPAGDFYTSPNDPAFWLHHGMIDRTWTIWQSQDLANRVQVIAGGKSMMSFGGAGAQGSLEDLIDLGVVGDKVYKIKELVSTVDGPFCYVYE